MNGHRNGTQNPVPGNKTFSRDARPVDVHILGREDDGAVQVQFDTESVEPGLAVAEAVAEIEGRDPSELSAIYDYIDHVIDHLFSDPPDPEANVEISFDYEGYRITVQQSGEAVFVPMQGR